MGSMESTGKRQAIFFFRYHKISVRLIYIYFFFKWEFCFLCLLLGLSWISWEKGRKRWSRIPGNTFQYIRAGELGDRDSLNCCVSVVMRHKTDSWHNHIMKACYHWIDAAFQGGARGRLGHFQEFPARKMQGMQGSSMGMFFRSLKMNAFACQQLPCSLDCTRKNKKTKERDKINLVALI